MMSHEAYTAEVQRMREVIAMPDEERRKLGYTTSANILAKDLECGIFHYIHPRLGYEAHYVYDLQTALDAMKRRDAKNASVSASSVEDEQIQANAQNAAQTHFSEDFADVIQNMVIDF